MTADMPTYDSAESLRKSKKYEDAAHQFAVLWQQRPNIMSGWRYAYCLRKLGQLEKADAVARAVLEKFPDDKYTKSELGWILYERELKPAKEESDLGRAIHFANEILKLNSDAFATQRVSLSIMKVAKDRGKWSVVLEWANKIQPQDLSIEPMLFDGKRGMSDRETWYLGKARALLELRQYATAREFAQIAVAEFPDEIFLARTAALALARSGDLKGGAAEVRKLLNHRRADWYVKADLAELEYQLGNHAEAYRLMCEAVSNPQDDEFKLGCFVVLAQISLAINKSDVAAEHVALAKAVRTANNWSISTELLQLEKTVQNALNAEGLRWPELPQDAMQLSKICHQRWREGAVEGLEFYGGTLGIVNPDKTFAFIKRDDGGENVFVIVREIPRNCVREGARLEFILKKSFDKKKNRESVQAANIRCRKD